MFQKPAFGANTSNFGSFNSGTAAASPFGSFKPTTPATGFGAPAFGAGASTQPATGGGLFGAQNTTGGLFGNNAASTSTSGFGASTSGFGFGAPTSTGGLFGANNTSGGGLFGNTQAQPAFGAKPAGFGFGAAPAPATTGGTLFGSTPASNTGLFGQQNNTMGGGGLFSNTGSAFGQPQTATGTAQVKYNPVVGTDVVVKSGQSQTVNIKHHCITCMKEYENKSLEELRLEDYVAGNKGQTQPAGFGASPFGQQQENKPMFPAQSAFGQPATTNTSSVFGATLSSAPAFGQTSSFSFGQNQQANTSTTGLFATNKPAFGATATPSTGLFGATTTQAQPATSSFGFGANTTQNQQQAGGLFGAKPAGAFGAGAFGASTNTAAPFGGGLFGAKTSAPAFGTTTPAFGTMSGGFGTNTSTSGGLFGGGSTFGKPATTQPAFGFNAQPTLGAGLGAGVANNTFQAKPATGAFGTLGTTNMFQQPTNNTTFKTGLEGGLGGGLFGNTSTLGGSTLGMGTLNTNTNALANNSLSGASAAGNVHEQILTLAARPYGDSPLFKDLLPDSSTTTEDVLKPTNPAAVKAVLDKCQYRVTSPTTRLTVRPRPAAGDKGLTGEMGPQKGADSETQPDRTPKPTTQCQEPAIPLIDIHINNNNYSLINLKVVNQTEFDIFCESLALQLNNMPLKQALKCQEKLQAVMFECRLDNYANYDSKLSSTVKKEPLIEDDNNGSETIHSVPTVDTKVSPDVKSNNIDVKNVPISSNVNESETIKSGPTVDTKVSPDVKGNSDVRNAPFTSIFSAKDGSESINSVPTVDTKVSPDAKVKIDVQAPVTSIFSAKVGSESINSVPTLDTKVSPDVKDNIDVQNAPFTSIFSAKVGSESINSVPTVDTKVSPDVKDNTDVKNAPATSIFSAKDVFKIPVTSIFSTK